MVEEGGTEQASSDGSDDIGQKAGPNTNMWSRTAALAGGGEPSDDEPDPDAPPEGAMIA